MIFFEKWVAAKVGLTMRIPGFWSRVALAVGVIVVSAAWLMRPLDRSVLIPLNFRPGRAGTPGEVRYINLEGREVSRELQSVGNLIPASFPGHTSYPRIRGYADSNGLLKYHVAWEKLPSEIELVPVRQGKLWGYMNRSSQWVVEPRYSVAEVYQPVGIGAVSLGGKWGAINRTGQLIVPCEYDTITCGSNGGVTYVNATVRNPVNQNWLNKVQTWIDSHFRTNFSNPVEESIFDSKGNVIWRRSWIFKSWASVWILWASVWIAAECSVRSWRERRRRREALLRGAL